jgi:hypothetical protein
MDAMQLGRTMMSESGNLKDDKQSCDWARIGQLLTQLGSPKMPRTIRDLKPSDRSIVIEAVKALQARASY